jgi:phosphotransferase system enzyme I (PtsP)
VERLGTEIGIPHTELPPLGIMMEVPAVIHQLDDYRDIIDFVSVGTNDLTQYLLAVDRNSNIVGHLYSGFHPAVLRTLNDIFLKTKSLGKEVTICGELAGTAPGALALISIGYRQLSILPSRAPVIRYLCKRISEDFCRTVQSTILSERKEREIERYLSEVLESIEPSLIEIE